MVSRHAIEPSGFSLVELTIALAIMGLLGGLAMPSLVRMTERISFSLYRQDVERQIDQLPQNAAAHARSLTLSSTVTENGETPAAGPDAYPVNLPEGWDIIVDKPIRYRYDGICSGGRLRIMAPGSQADYVLNPPLCELRPG